MNNMDVGKRKNRCGKLIIFVFMALFVFGQYAPAQTANKTGDPITLNRTVYIILATVPESPLPAWVENGMMFFPPTAGYGVPGPCNPPDRCNEQ